MTIMAVIGMLLISGCVQQETGPSDTGQPTGPSDTTPDTSPPSSGPDITALVACAEQNGHECSIGYECNGDWLDASDTFSCCSQSCESGGLSEDEILDIELFEENLENEELGDLT